MDDIIDDKYTTDTLTQIMVEDALDNAEVEVTQDDDVDLMDIL